MLNVKKYKLLLLTRYDLYFYDKVQLTDVIIQFKLCCKKTSDVIIYNYLTKWFLDLNLRILV